MPTLENFPTLLTSSTPSSVNSALNFETGRVTGVLTVPASGLDGVAILAGAGDLDVFRDLDDALDLGWD